MKTIAYAVIFLALLASGISYLVWLDAGCETAGVMTMEGKVCFDDLAS